MRHGVTPWVCVWCVALWYGVTPAECVYGAAVQYIIPGQSTKWAGASYKDELLAGQHTFGNVPTVLMW